MNLCTKRNCKAFNPYVCIFNARLKDYSFGDDGVPAA